MKFIIKGGGLNFCNKVACGGEVCSDLPALLQSYNKHGGCEVFFSDENTAIGGGDVIFGVGEAVWYHKSTCENTVVSIREYVALKVHIARESWCGCEISCEDAMRYIGGENLQYSDCASFDGSDILFFKFEKHLIVAVYQNGEYILSSPTPCDRFEMKNSGVEFSFSPPNTCGISLFGSCTFGEIASGVIKGDGEFSLEYSKYHEQRSCNYILQTYPTCFFERVMFCRLLKQNLRENFLKSHISSSLSCSVDVLCEFLGNFCGIIPCFGGVIAVYKVFDGVFETRKFQLELLGGEKTVVENIMEIEEYELCQLPDDVKTLIYLW